MANDPKPPLVTRIVAAFLRGDVAVLLVFVSLALGVTALLLTPREEEPQIVVPLADVMIRAPGLSARDVERKVTRELEKLLFQIDGVEYVYSMSRPGEAIVTVRFFVGEDREDSLIKLYNKVQSNVDRVPADVAGWVVKPIEVDDVPIVNITLWSSRPRQYGDHELRRLAEEFQNDLQAIQNTNRVWVIGGRPRRIRVELDPARLAARQTSPLEVARALRASNVNVRAGTFEQQDREFVVDAGTFVPNADALKDLVVNIAGDRPVYLADVATVTDGPDEAESYTWIGFGPADQGTAGQASSGTPESATSDALYPAVHIAVAKRKGSNAVWVADAVQERMRRIAREHLPEGVHYRITRDYGETANEKVNNLVASLGIAVVTVIALIGVIIGWRAALVIALAVPVCYSITLFVNLLTGYTINRVTLFALILALGLLVDDPITDVENIARYFGMKRLGPREATLRAIQEVQPALILSTLAIIASFLPLMFITGMMGPYMAPMALNVPLTVTVSTVVALVITPWVAMVALKGTGQRQADEQEYDLSRSPMYRLSRAVLGPILSSRLLSWGVLAAVTALLVVTMTLPAFRLVPLKMLPYDNKDEFQLVVDMPEGTTLERTDAVLRDLGGYLSRVPEVRDFQLYAGVASPMDFNGMVRHYFLREAPNLGDIRVNLAPKEKRVQQSHTLLLRIRDKLTAIADAAGAELKLVEVPPGPPVIATITAEVYGPAEASYEQLIAAAKNVERRMEQEPLLVDVDTSAEAEQPKRVFKTDQPKAALSGVSKKDVADVLQVALEGMPVTVLQVPGEVEPLWVDLRIARSERSAEDDLEELYLKGRQGQMVQLGALGEFVSEQDGEPLYEDKTIYHKNLRRVVYVYGEVAGRPPADAILDMQLDRDDRSTINSRRSTINSRRSTINSRRSTIGGVGSTGETPVAPGEGETPVAPGEGETPVAPGDPTPVESRTWLNPGGGVPWSMPPGYEVVWAGEGEWKITLDVFRDLGLAFAAALLGIFVILMFQTGSRLLPLVIMLAIPLTMIGIMPGFWLLNLIVDVPVGGYPNPVFFTATAMIGMIALGGIVVRNSVVLIDFINQSVGEGTTLREAIIQSVAVRTRPIVLTAGTTLLGNWVITLDPIFSGLAWAIIFGILTSTVFTLVVVPVVYWLLYGSRAPAK